MCRVYYAARVGGLGRPWGAGLVGSGAFPSPFFSCYAQSAPKPLPAASMVCADALLMTVKPRLEAFLKPADAREAATLLKALLKEFATDALRVLKSQTERANEEKALLSEQLDRSQRECAEAKREWHRRRPS